MAFYNELPRLCFNGEGRGRIRFLQERHLFSYESLISLDQQQFSLAMNLPVYGEELMTLGWKPETEVDRKWYISGSFYERLQFKLEEAASKQQYEAKLLNDYLASLAYFFAFYEATLKEKLLMAKEASLEDFRNSKGPNNKSQCRLTRSDSPSDIQRTFGVCNYSDRVIYWNFNGQEFNFQIAVNADYNLTLKGLGPAEGFYERLDLSLEKTSNSSVPTATLELSLFASKCQGIF